MYLKYISGAQESYLNLSKNSVSSVLFITENFLSKENEAELIIAPIMKKKREREKIKKRILECSSI